LASAARARPRPWRPCRLDGVGGLVEQRVDPALEGREVTDGGGRRDGALEAGRALRHLLRVADPERRRCSSRATSVEITS
jgi:hypothetical protein